jgi:hypothetical protein
MQLIVGVDLPRAIALPELALGPPHVGAAQHRAHVLEADAVARQRRWIEIDAHRGQRAAADEDLPDAFDLRQALLQDRRRRVVELAGAHRVRGE